MYLLEFNDYKKPKEFTQKANPLGMVFATFAAMSELNPTYLNATTCVTNQAEAQSAFSIANTQRFSNL